MQEQRTDHAYPFARAKKVMEGFVEKEAPRELIQQWIAGFRRRPDLSTNYLETLGNYMPGLLEATHPVTTPYPETFTPMLRDLGTALKKLLDGELQPTDRDDIALITAFGQDLLDQARAYFADSAWPPEPDQDYWHEHVADLNLVVDMEKEFAKVSRQLALDVAALRGMGPQSR